MKKAAKPAPKKNDKPTLPPPASKPTGEAPRNEVPQQLGDFLTTNQGVRLSDNHNSLKAGPRGPALLEDFILREKITSFDHERIPERVVHARGAGAFGTFECKKSMKSVTAAGLFGAVGKKTPLFLRFSTVAGSRGSADTARDVRGFAVKFYTDEGNFDLVGNNMPVFFIQDAMKFPDLIHAVKPEPHNEIPQAQSAHDTFWDFVSLMPESTHMLFWVMSDRAIPRSYRMMEGFGVHTFRFVNEKGDGTFVKFHWKPKLGIHGITWEESLNLAGQDPDFHRRDLWENIAKGAFPEWDLGVQLIPEADEFKYDFDLLDPTKLVPEELVPVEVIGTMTLNRNPENFFAETEQVAFHVGNLVPGIDVTNDPLMQGRLFSYVDTQITRLGGPNFHQLPINRPLNDVHNHQRDGFHQTDVPKGRVAYEPNSLGGGCPFHSPEKMKSFVHFTERMDAHKVRARSTSFGDHFSQAKLFFESQTKTEQNHIRDAFSFELSKVETKAIRERMVDTLSLVNPKLADEIAANIGVKVSANAKVQPNPADPENNIIPENHAMQTALGDEPSTPKKNTVKAPKTSDTLSMIKTAEPSLETRKIAILTSKDSDNTGLSELTAQLEKEGAAFELVGEDLGPFPGASVEITKTYDNTTSLHYDAVWVCDGKTALTKNGLARRFVLQAFKHCKTIGGAGKGAEFCNAVIQSQSDLLEGDPKTARVGMASNPSASNVSEFVKLAKTHRHWNREPAVTNLAT